MEDMSRSLRTLLPASGGQQNSPDSSPSPQIPKRTASKAACEACRKRKSKCTAERPRCAICIERGSTCEYKTLPAETHLTAQKRQLTDLRAKCDVYEDLIGILRNREPQDASDVLQKVRAGEEVAAIVQSFHVGDVLLQLRQQPPDRPRYEFPYRPEWPSFLLNEAASGFYLDSILYQTVVTQAAARQSPPADPEAPQSEINQMYLFPYHSVTLVDPRLDSADVAQWTRVSSDNEMLRRLLKIYFVHEYPFHPFFHKDLFLNALSAGNQRSQRFCSSLLVNAVLAAAWHGMTDCKMRSDYWHPNNMGYRFLAEAKRLLDLEQGIFPQITLVQGTAILNLTCNLNGIDELSWSFLHQSLEAAHKLGLFVPSPESDPLWQRAAAITAWSLFNWQALACFHSFMPPLLEDPPTCPLPEPDAEPNHYAEILVTYPGSDAPVEIGNGHVFKAISEFRIILNDIVKQAFRTPRSPSLLSLRSANDAHLRLLAWYKQLPGVLAPSRIAWPSHLKVHMHFHAVVAFLFETFEHLDAPDGDEDPATLVTRSKACFETILRLYYLRHGFEQYDAMLPQFLSMVAFGTARRLREGRPDPEIRQQLLSTLILCAKGLWEQGRNCYAAEASFYYLKDSLTAEDASLVVREVPDFREDHNRKATMIREIRSQWPFGVARPDMKPADHCLSAYLHGEAPWR